MSIIRAIYKTFWHLLLLTELIIWGSTTFHLGWSGLVPVIAVATIIPLLLAVEGLELAVASLLSRKPDGLSSMAADELTRISADPALPFFPNRQVFVVISIVLLTMSSSFQEIYVPGLGWTAKYNLPTLLNLTFPTHMVLLFAQVPGKMLALYAPSKFFNQSWIICVAVRWAGYFEVTNPANPITKLLANLLGYPVRHTQHAPDVQIVYPVYDYIDSQWYYVAHEDEAAV